MRRSSLVPLAALVGLLSLTACGPTPQEGEEAEPPAEAADSLVLRTAGEIAWTEGRSPGEEVAVLYGTPSGSGPFALRVRFPPNHHVRAHTHPQAEMATVLEGTVHVATGEGTSREDAEAYGAGSFVAFPAGTVISAWTGEEGAVVQVHGEAPFETRYLEEGAGDAGGGGG